MSTSFLTNNIKVDQKTVILPYSEHKELLDRVEELEKNKRENTFFISHSNGDVNYYRYVYNYRVVTVPRDEIENKFKEELDVISDIYDKSVVVFKRIINDKCDEIHEFNKHLTKLKNRNWFERLFNIDM